MSVRKRSSLSRRADSMRARSVNSLRSSSSVTAVAARSWSIATWSSLHVPRLPVEHRDGAHAVPFGGDQRGAGVRGDAVLGDRQVGAEHGVAPRVGHHERAPGGDGVLTDRMVERNLPQRCHPLRETAGALEVFGVLADEGDERGGRRADGRGQTRETVQRLVRLQACQGEPSKRDQPLRLLKNGEINHVVGVPDEPEQVFGSPSPAVKRRSPFAPENPRRREGLDGPTASGWAGGVAAVGNRGGGAPRKHGGHGGLRAQEPYVSFRVGEDRVDMVVLNKRPQH